MYGVDAPTPELVRMCDGEVVEIHGPVQIELEIPCSRCGYSLRGLKTDGKCPECRAPVKASVFGDRLEYADRGYVRGLRVGGMLASGAVGAMLVGVGVAVPPLLFCMIFMRSGPPPNWLGAIFMFTFFVLPGLCAGVALAGWWLMTMPDPAHQAVAGERKGADVMRPDPRARRWLRAVLIAESVCWLMLVGVGLLGVLHALPPAVYAPLAQMCAMLAPFLLLGHLVISAYYFRAMGVRLGSLFVEQVALAQVVASVATAVMVVLCIAAIASGAEWLIVCVLLVTLLCAAVTAGIHIGMSEVIRRSARDAIAAMERPRREGRRLGPLP